MWTEKKADRLFSQNETLVDVQPNGTEQKWIRAGLFVELGDVCSRICIVLLLPRLHDLLRKEYNVLYNTA